jgi:bifunctional non-homologous end joining protein LigD
MGSAYSGRGGSRLPEEARGIRARGGVHTRAARLGDGVTHDVRLTSADRVLFPEAGVTKGDLFAYYDSVADRLVPHLRNRPFTMKRYREGAGGRGFFQKQAPKGMPSWIPTRRYRTHPREGGSRLVDFPLVNSREALLWMVQMHCIDMNAWYSRVDKPDRPDFVLFDLDPPEDGFREAVRVAHLLRALLDTLELRAHVKTSGANGIHVLVPIVRRSGFDDTYAFAEAVSRRLENEHPGLVTTEWLKRKREGVLVDHRQNGWGKTIASVYSVRPKPAASVSTPLRWEELAESTRPSDFTIPVVLERLERHGDLFEPVLRGAQALGPAQARLARL